VGGTSGHRGERRIDGPDDRLRLERLLGTEVRDCRGVGGQHGVRHSRATLADGRTVFAKLGVPRAAANHEAARGYEAPDRGAGDRGAAGDGTVAGRGAAGDGTVAGRGAAGDGTAPGRGAAGDRTVAGRGAAGLAAVGFEAEARGLGWLGEARAAPVPEVLGWDEATLVISWVPEEAPSRQAAERFGRDLARLHTSGAAAFGAPWPGSIAGLPLENEPGSSWPEWYGMRRLLPYARLARDAGSLSPQDVRLIETVAARMPDLAGPPEPPSRIHGDCWSGNVLWSGGRGWLIDPAAHGGHRETDLAMLALFGAPFLGRIVSSYQEVAPLSAGWRGRVPLHQLHPLLVHVCLFGAGYRPAALDAARGALAGVS
jgi:fructosamine-3-kinase